MITGWHYWNVMFDHKDNEHWTIYLLEESSMAFYSVHREANLKGIEPYNFGMEHDDDAD